MTSQRYEIDVDAKRRERNRKKAPDSVALAEALFDLARALRSEDLETLAIRVDDLAQDGKNIDRAATERILDEAMATER